MFFFFFQIFFFQINVCREVTRYTFQASINSAQGSRESFRVSDRFGNHIGEIWKRRKPIWLAVGGCRYQTAMAGIWVCSADMPVLTSWPSGSLEIRLSSFLFLFYQSQKNHTTSSLQSGAAAVAQCCMARLQRNTAAITRQQPAEMSLDYDD